MIRSCRHCGADIRMTRHGWGHVQPYRVGVMHPVHKATPR